MFFDILNILKCGLHTYITLCTYTLHAYTFNYANAMIFHLLIFFIDHFDIFYLFSSKNLFNIEPKIWNVL